MTASSCVQSPTAAAALLRDMSASRTCRRRTAIERCPVCRVIASFDVPYIVANLGPEGLG